MITENSPALGTFSSRDSVGSTFDARRRSDGIDIEVIDAAKAAYVVLHGDDTFEFTKWLAAQLSEEDRAALKASL